jgi:hypothetical protein
MGVYELSGAGSVKTGRTLYTSMNAGNQFGAMVPIASTTLASAANIAISNIPQTYQDLMIVVSARGTYASATDTCIAEWGYFNEYSNTYLTGNGTSASSSRGTGAYGAGPTIPAASATAGIFGSLVFHILNYANTTTYKTMLTRNASDANGSGVTQLVATLRLNTSAVNFFEIGGANAVLAAGTSMTIYGIRAVSS